MFSVSDSTAGHIYNRQNTEMLCLSAYSIVSHGNTVVFLTDIFKRIDMPPEDMDKIGSDEKQRKSTGNCFPITETLLPIEHVAVDRREAVKSKLP